MQAKQYLVSLDHTSEFPEPIAFAKGTLLTVGELYEGPEDWSHWRFCDTPGQQGGWVPEQILEFVDNSTARAKQDYTAQELTVRTGEVLLGTASLNGWLWCTKSASGESGWVPLANLQPAP